MGVQIRQKICLGYIERHKHFWEPCVMDRPSQEKWSALQKFQPGCAPMKRSQAKEVEVAFEAIFARYRTHYNDGWVRGETIVSFLAVA